MTNFSLDNSADSDLDKIVIWQYDQAPNICRLFDQLKVWFNDVCGGVWDDVIKRLYISDPEKCDDFGLSIWGRLTETPRLMVVIGDEEKTISSELYRRIILARFRCLNSNASKDSFDEFMSFVFGDNAIVVDNHDMSLSFSWTGAEEELTEEEEEMKYVLDNYMDFIFPFPTGVHDNDKSDSLMLWLAENASDNPATGVQGGGLDESSFTWK